VKLIDDVLDVLGFILLLGVCIAVSFSVVLPMTKQETNTTALADKTAPKSVGYVSNSGYDGKMSKMEVVLMTQVQDFNMPEPKVFMVGTMKKEIGSVYEGQDTEISFETIAQLNISDPTGSKRYSFKYNFNGVDPYYLITGQ
jgi:hypothetical protein